MSTNKPITKHRCYDDRIENVTIKNSSKVILNLSPEMDDDYLILHKEDTIALAKHFGLTEEDLRDV